jgi:hypothetical protein
LQFPGSDSRLQEIGAEVYARARTESSAQGELPALEPNRRRIVLPFYAKFGWWLNRWLPGASAPLHRRVLQGFRRMREE